MQQYEIVIVLTPLLSEETSKEAIANLRTKSKTKRQGTIT